MNVSPVVRVLVAQLLSALVVQDEAWFGDVGG